MGNNFSNGNNLYVQVDRPYYSQGDPINGQVLLNCSTPFQATALVLKIEGYEQTRWEEKREDRNYDSEREEWTSTETTRPFSGKREIFKIKMPLQTYPQQVPPGQYQFPFSCVLPANLPGSFEFSGQQLYYNGCYHNYVKGKIRYKVKAECEVPGMLKANLKAKQHLMVHERLTRPPSQVVLEDRQKVTACCCCGKGHAYIIAHVEKDSYFPGEVVNVILQVDNQSTADFSEVKLELHRKIKLKSDGSNFETDEELAEVKKPGIGRGESWLKEAARPYSLQLPPGLQSSANGSIVRCDYTIELRLKGSAFMSDLKVKLPILIHQAVPQHTAYTAPPAFWTPDLVAPAVQVALPSAPPLPPDEQAMRAGAYVPPNPT